MIFPVPMAIGTIFLLKKHHEKCFSYGHLAASRISIELEISMLFFLTSLSGFCFPL
jgi:hypothetical protein